MTFKFLLNETLPLTSAPYIICTILKKLYHGSKGHFNVNEDKLFLQKVGFSKSKSQIQFLNISEYKQ